MHEIKEVKNLHEALKSIHYNSWVILDLDNTVMESCADLGGDAWFNSFRRQCLQKASYLNLPIPELEKKIISVYDAVQWHTRTQPVEKSIVTVIKALNHIGIPLIGLTARGKAIAQATRRQLGDIGVVIPTIIFCAGKNKGENLRKFLEDQDYLPEELVMLDDNRDHINKVSMSLNRLALTFDINIRFTGLRYAYLDAKLNDFDQEKANLQLMSLKKYLPSEARQAIDDLQVLSQYPEVRNSRSLHSFFRPIFSDCEHQNNDNARAELQSP